MGLAFFIYIISANFGTEYVYICLNKYMKSLCFKPKVH